jgi:hypothetical protein
MKKCPTCEKTFEDSMRFCQSDGTPLIEVAEEIDPYKTMVARPGEIAAAIPSQAFDKPAERTPEPIQPPPAEEEEVLQIPSTPDPMKTQFVSEAEIRKEMAASSPVDEPVMEIPPASATPTPPAFIEPDLNPVNVAPPPSPFSQPDESFGSSSSGSPPMSSSRADSPGNMTTPPIPSPFGSQGSKASDVSPMVPQFKGPEPEPEPTPVIEPVPSTPFIAPVPSSPFEQQASVNPFDQPPVVQPSASTPPNQEMAQAEWTPQPVAATPNNKNMDIGSNMPPSGNAPAGQSSTLAIISLVCGILGVTVCCGTFIVPLIGLILGFMARGRANSDPAHYGGAGLAMGGIITGALGLIGGVVLWVVYIFYFAAIMSQMPR